MMNDERRIGTHFSLPFIIHHSSFIVHEMSSTAIILAAGKSTRMKSARPKPLHEVCGRPMLEYVLRACFDAGCSKVIVVIGHGKDEIISRFESESRIHWVEQTEQLGTGHAARMCIPILQEHPSDVFILTGDGPLIRGEVLRTLLQAHREEKAAASMATAVLDDPTGYGRIVRDEAGDFVEIVEQGDATAQQREIREVFPSYYCLKSDELTFGLSKLNNQNSKREYYLTDVYRILQEAGRKVLAVQAVTQEDAMAVNDRMQLAEVDAIMQDRIHRKLRSEGITIVSGVNTYVEDGAAIGRDTTIQPFTFIGRDSSIGPECQIGPFATLPRESIVPAGTVISGNVAADNPTLNEK
jgi:bifunctional UDP-N-acetylglucosamine pyrophosphorylase / glucosamine-1-phosphate N-acetyltransferase